MISREAKLSQAQTWIDERLETFDASGKGRGMASGYDRESIWEMAEKASADMTTFYQQPFVNYRGTTLDTGELYTEVVAEWCLANQAKFDEIPCIERKFSYNQHHEGITSLAHSNREEERIAMDLFRQSRDEGGFSSVGRIIDYQTPLKSKRSDKAGKVDLLAFDGRTLRILELKAPDSKESVLRCVLEGYTYLRTVSSDKLIEDFEDDLGGTPERICCAPLVFRNGYQHACLQERRPYLQKLVKQMSDGVFLLSSQKPYEISSEYHEG